MAQGPFNGPRPFVGSSLDVLFVFPREVGSTDLDIESRLRANGFNRADVTVEESGTDTRVQVTVKSNEEEMTFALLRRLVAQVKNESDSKIDDSDITVFCT